jgi:CBS domain containing-hemolysin-like protein
MDYGTLTAVAALLILLLMSGYFAMAETALLTVTVIQARRMVEDKRPRAETLLKLLEHRSSFLTTILLLTLVSQLSASSIAGALSYRYFNSWGAAAATAAVTILIFIYCEVAPKTYAVENAERVALRVSPAIRRYGLVFGPVVRVLVRIAAFSTRIIGIKTTEAGPYMTEEELMTAVEISEEEGVIKEEEKKLIHHIFEFGDTIVREVMTPRPDMICISEDETPEKALDVVIKEGHSRIPVFSVTVDNIVGVLYARDLLGLSSGSAGRKPETIKPLIRPAMFVPETKRVADLLREIQQEKIHMAVVIDEYGSTAGLATIEDLLEEIVGEIYDEYDLERKEMEPLGEDALRVDARVPIDDINEYFRTNLEYPEVDSVGGLVMELFGRVPRRGEATEAGGLRFVVEKVSGNRVGQIHIDRIQQPQSGAGDE